MDTKTIIGLIAGALTTVSFLPQVLKTWRSRSTHDLSLSMYLAFSSGVVLWLVYGVMISSLPVILTNTVTLALTAVILALKLRYR
ncbi:MAG TPA: SemiSWEET transporter [candidate division Zixibacteria bacterium]|nr:SemiSWEET transporter [candidate division Zixibacteria bacterium]